MLLESYDLKNLMFHSVFVPTLGLRRSYLELELELELSLELELDSSRLVAPSTDKLKSTTPTTTT